MERCPNATPKNRKNQPRTQAKGLQKCMARVHTDDPAACLGTGKGTLRRKKGNRGTQRDMGPFLGTGNGTLRRKNGNQGKQRDIYEKVRGQSDTDDPEAFLGTGDGRLRRKKQHASFSVGVSQSKCFCAYLQVF